MGDNSFQKYGRSSPKKNVIKLYKTGQTYFAKIVLDIVAICLKSD